MTTADQTRHVEPGPDDRGREERKRDRQMIELLNELRVALPGVQILFAFLLTVPRRRPRTGCASTRASGSGSSSPRTS